MVNVLICGTGAASHVLAAYLATSPHWNPALFSCSDNAARFSTSLHRQPLHCQDHTSTRHISPPHPASFHATAANLPVFALEHAHDAAVFADVILLALPSFAHETYLRHLLPHCTRRILLLIMPAYGCVDLLVAHVCRDLSPLPSHLHLVITMQLPWICRVESFARIVHVFMHRASLDAVILRVLPHNRFTRPEQSATEQVRSLLAYIHHGKLVLSETPSSALAYSLFIPNAMMHAALFYGFLRCTDALGYQKEAFDTPPLFYKNTSPKTAALLDAISSEVLTVKVALTNLNPSWNHALATVSSFHDWYAATSIDGIEDPTSTHSCLRTNRATAALLMPMVQGKDQLYRPDFSHRFLMENIPCGLLSMRSLARLVQVPTPAMDTVISWAQEKIGTANGREFQRFGVHTVRQLQSIYDNT